MPALPYWFWPGDDRPTAEIDDEIAEELRLHLDLLEEEQARQGVPREEAKRHAAERFGDFDTLVRRCRAEKQGDLPMLRRVQTTLIVFLLIGVASIGWSQWRMSTSISSLQESLSATLTTLQVELRDFRDGIALESASKLGTPQVTTEDRLFTVSVVDEIGSPVPGAKLFIEHWGVDDSVVVETDSKGTYLSNEPSKGGRITTLAPGYVFTSQEFRPRDVRVVLQKAPPFNIQFNRIDGSTPGRLTVFLVSRTDLADRTTMAIHAEPRLQTDEQGIVTFDCLLPGDIVKLSLKERGPGGMGRNAFEETVFEVPSDPSEGVTVWLASNGGRPFVGPEPPPNQSSEGGSGGGLGGYGSGEFGGVYGGGRYGGGSGGLHMPLHLDAKKRIRTKADLTGTVNNAAGKPVADADVLLIVKTWPNNRFRQDDYAVKTDASGKFELKGRIPLDGQYGINATVVAEGQAIASQYVLVEDPAGQPPEDLGFQLEPSIKTPIVVTNSDGEPIARALVAPSGRVAADDTEHNVYHQGSNPVWKKTDAEGAVTVDWFAKSDLGLVRIRPRGSDWQEKKFDLTDVWNGAVRIAVED